MYYDFFGDNDYDHYDYSFPNNNYSKNNFLGRKKKYNSYNPNTTTTTSSTEMKENKCQECKRPFMRRKEDTWKKFCTYCIVKIKGEIIDCATEECKTRLAVYENQLSNKNYCRNCYKQRNGISANCSKCSNIFYYMENTKESKEFCETCFLTLNGIKKKCKDCKEVIWIKKEDKAWKKRCYECWLEPGKKINFKK
jgi:hypothetical protein